MKDISWDNDGLFRLTRLMMPLVCLHFLFQLACVFILFEGSLKQLGHRIPTADITSDFCMAFLLSVFLIPCIFISPWDLSHKLMLAKAWVLRCFVAMIFSLFYEDHYALDAFSYFNQAKDNSYEALLGMIGFGRGTENITLLIKLIGDLLPVESYHGVKVIFAFIGMHSAYFFFRSLTIFSGVENKFSFWMLSCFPSLVFWTSILGKDPLVLLGLSIFVLGISYIMRRRFLRGSLYFVSGIFLASLIRSWLLPIFLLPFCLLLPYIAFRNIFNQLILVGGIILLCNIYYHSTFNPFQLASEDELLLTVNRLSRGWAFGGSAQISPTFNTFKDLIEFLPYSSFAAVFRPLPGEVENAFGWLAGLENIFLLAVSSSIFFLLFIRYKAIRWVPFVYLAMTVICWSLVYGFVSYQNLGTAFRFRTQIVPFIFLAFFLILSKDHLKLVGHIK